MLQEPPPVLVVDHFPVLLDALLDLLGSLSAEKWQLPVHGGKWRVKELAQHLLGDEINILSGKRDQYSGTYIPIQSWDELVRLIDQKNAEWVAATGRMSPRVICDLLRWTGDQVNAYFRSVDLFAPGSPVSWAGPDPAPVWLDVAREFTERWHHQQHIRDAVGKPGCTDADYLGPVLAAYVRALPQTYRNVAAPLGSSVMLLLTGDGGGTWSVIRDQDRWQLYAGRPDCPQAEVEMPADLAWRLFTKGVTPGEARQKARLSGDLQLAEKALETVSIIA